MNTSAPVVRARTAAEPTRRVAVIGDVAGHLNALREELIRLGAHPVTLDLPADLVVVQVGDLVHRGPDSEGVVALVGRYLFEQPGQWKQLVGNHEAQYLREPVFRWPETISHRAASALRSWWESGAMRAAAAVRTDGAEFLITHAGLTEGFWRQVLGAPGDAAAAESALNALIGAGDDALFAEGQLLGGGGPNFSAGPLWASAGAELIPSWYAADTPLPFSQVHGHSSVADWRGRRFTVDREIGRLIGVDEQRAHTIANLSGGQIIGIDPGHGRRVRQPWQALVLSVCASTVACEPGLPARTAGSRFAPALCGVHRAEGTSPAQDQQ